MSQPPPIQPGSRPPPLTLDYGRPVAERHNQWWKVLLRISAGLVTGFGCAFVGALLADWTQWPWMLFVPGGIVFGVLLFLTIKYRRFGYLTGLLISPVVIVVGIIVTIIIICAA